ncbi:helix-turn-helix transcriptional regulator [Streptomyces sp. NPDC005901]|uniref:helix-turn-helix domain-containing protein n=1 Tax=Streptomyces sp. NPDC005901 TaxID=3157171 RepID=UPI0033D746E7
MATRSAGSLPQQDGAVLLPLPSEVFLEALRGVLTAVGLTQDTIAKRAGVSQSSLSCYSTGRRVPDVGKLERIYKVLEDEAQRTSAQALPHTLPYLLQLRDAARAQRIAPSAANAAIAATATRPTQQPAYSAFRKRRRMKRLRLAHRKLATPTTQTDVPVPPHEGDRHPADNTHAADIAAYLSHVAAGRFRDAQFIVWAKGNSLASREFPHAIASYRDAGADDGAEAMLNAAANRADIQASVNITAALIDEGQVADAQAILTAIRTDQ